MIRSISGQVLLLCWAMALFIAPVVLADPPSLAVSGSFTFSAYSGDGNPDPHVITIANATHGDMSWSASANVSWVSFSPSSGSLPGLAIGEFNTTMLSVNISGLAVGTYTGNVTVSATWSAEFLAPVTNAPQTIPVTLNITDGRPIMSVSPAALAFSGVAGMPIPSQNLSITNTGPGTLVWTASVSPAANWLSINPSPGGLTVVAAAVSPGSYTASIVISAPGAITTSATVNVTLSVRAPVPPTFLVDTSPLFFAGSAGIPISDVQTISVENSGELPLNWDSSAVTTNGGAWLYPVAAGSSTLKVTVDTQGLPAGIYIGRVVLTAPGASNSPISIPVTLTLQKAASFQAITPSSLSFSLVTGAANPPSQSVTFQNGGDAALVWQATINTAGGGPWLKVSPASGNGNATVTLSVDAAGSQPGVYNGQLVLTAAAASNSPQVIPVTLTVLGPPSTINDPGPVNAASFAAGPLSPGMIAAVFGSRLGPSPAAAFDASSDTGSSSPGAPVLPTSLGGTTVTVDGIAAPLYYVSSAQITFQVPYEVAGKTSVHLIIQPAGSQASQLDVSLAPQNLAFFTSDGKQAAALNQDSSLNAAASPDAAGTVVTLFGTGQGGLNTGVATGAPAPSTVPFATPILPVSVNVNGEPAEILFDGMAPGLVGLLQVNLRIPLDIAPGPATITFQQGDTMTSQSVTISVGAAAVTP